MNHMEEATAILDYLYDELGSFNDGLTFEERIRKYLDSMESDDQVRVIIMTNDWEVNGYELEGETLCY